MLFRSRHQAGLAAADAVDRHEAIEAHAHQAVRRARRAGDRRGAALLEARLLGRPIGPPPEGLAAAADVILADDNYASIVAGIEDRMEVIVRFLAVLELFKQGQVDHGRGGFGHEGSEGTAAVATHPAPCRGQAASRAPAGEPPDKGRLGWNGFTKASSNE